MRLLPVRTRRDHAAAALAVVPDGSGVWYVDDATNTLNLLH